MGTLSSLVSLSLSLSLFHSFILSMFCLSLVFPSIILRHDRPTSGRLPGLGRGLVKLRGRGDFVLPVLRAFLLVGCESIGARGGDDFEDIRIDLRDGDYQNNNKKRKGKKRKAEIKRIN